MSEPPRLHVKRRRSADPPDALVLDRFKRQHRHGTDLHYFRLKEERERAEAREEAQEASRPRGESGRVQEEGERQEERRKRVFHLDGARAGDKRKGGGEDVATFVERSARGGGGGGKRVKGGSGDVVNEGLRADGKERVWDDAGGAGLGRPLKRPATRAVRGERTGAPPPPPPLSEAQRKQMEALGARMQEAVWEGEEGREARRAGRVSAPILSGARSREIHRLRTATGACVAEDGDVDMGDEGDYVYDTYILAPETGDAATHIDGLANIGYLEITDADQTLWESYLEDEDGEGVKDYNSEEDDENAEDYYGADYPEDELASDDEHDAGAYGYRGVGAPDDEEWDRDTGAWSEDEERDGDAAYERMMQPFRHKTPREFARVMNEGRDGGARKYPVLGED